MKKQTVIAVALLLLMPLVLMLGGFVSSHINPESAAGHPNYQQNWQRLNQLKIGSLLASFAIVAALWLVVCFLVIRAKERSAWWLLLAAGGPFGFAVLAILNDGAPAADDRYARFVRNLNMVVRAGYEACIFVAIWVLAYQGMVLKRNLMIMYQSATTGMSAAQIVDLQNASSGMWAFAEGNEVMYLMVLLYLLWPIAFNLAGRVVATTATPKAV